MKFGIHGLNNATLLVGASIRPVNAIHSFIETKADLAFCVSRKIQITTVFNHFLDLDTCGNGQIDSLEECELGSNHCVNCFCVDGATSDGNACYVGLAPGQIAGIVVACVGAPLIAGTVVLIVFAKQGKLKKKDKIALEKVPDNDNSIYKAISTNTTNSLHVVTTSNTEAG
jgi:hypothetical protein